MEGKGRHYCPRERGARKSAIRMVSADFRPNGEILFGLPQPPPAVRQSFAVFNTRNDLPAAEKRHPSRTLPPGPSLLGRLV